MPIPAVASHDVFLRALLNEQVKHKFGEKVAVENVLDGMGVEHKPELKSSDLSSAVLEDIEYLKGLGLVDFFPQNPHVRLTAMGVYTALLFDNIELRNTGSN